MQNKTHYQKHVFICTNQKEAGKTCCANTGGKDFFHHLKSRMKELGMDGPGKIRVSQSGCLGRCALGPCMVIYPEGRWYTYLTFDDLDEIITHDFVEGFVVNRLLII